MAGLEASRRASFGWLVGTSLAESEGQELLLSGETLRYEASFWPGLETLFWSTTGVRFGWHDSVPMAQGLAADEPAIIEPAQSALAEVTLAREAVDRAESADQTPPSGSGLGLEGVFGRSSDPPSASDERNHDLGHAIRSGPMPLPGLQRPDLSTISNQSPDGSEHREEISAPAPMRGIDRPLDIGHLSGVAGADVIRFVDIFGRADGLAPAIAEAASSMAESNHGTILTSDANLSGYAVARAWDADASPRGSVAEVAIDNALVDTGADTDTELPAPHPLIDPWAETYVVLAPSVTDI